MSNQLSNYELSLERLNELKIPDPDLLADGDVAIASDYAFNMALDLLKSLHERFPSDFPYCSSTLDSRGGIDLVWDKIKPRERIWVIVPHDHNLKGSIYTRRDTFIEGLVLEDLVNEISESIK